MRRQEAESSLTSRASSRFSIGLASLGRRCCRCACPLRLRCELREPRGVSSTFPHRSDPCVASAASLRAAACCRASSWLDAMIVSVFCRMCSALCYAIHNKIVSYCTGRNHWEFHGDRYNFSTRSLAWVCALASSRWSSLPTSSQPPIGTEGYSALRNP